MVLVNQQAVRAADDNAYLERFITAQQQFILRCAGKNCGRFVDRSDDEFSIALMAFYEAVQAYNPANGGFLPFAATVISRRLTDYHRGQRRFSCEIQLAPQAFDGTIDPDEGDTSLQLAVAEQAAQPQALSAAGEIEAANALFADYGFTFYDLADCSPRADKTRTACAKAAAVLLRTPGLLGEMKKTKQLPIGQLVKSSGVPKKVIERHRRYLIAAALLLSGDYPMLSEYLQGIRKELERCGL